MDQSISTRTLESSTERKPLTAKSVAEALNNCEYGKEIPAGAEAQIKAAGLVVVFGASDDLMEFHGAINDEVGCYNGGSAKVDQAGLLPDRKNVEGDDELREYFKREPLAVSIDAIWAAEAGYSWTFRTTIPHETFEVVEDGAPYCRGIVFALADVVAK